MDNKKESKINLSLLFIIIDKEKKDKNLNRFSTDDFKKNKINYKDCIFESNMPININNEKNLVKNIKEFRSTNKLVFRGKKLKSNNNIK